MNLIRKKLGNVLNIYNTDLAYANRFTIVSCIITTILEVALLLYNLIAEKTEGWDIFNVIFTHKYAPTLILLIFSAIVWMKCSDLNSNLHTMLIISVMVIIVQMLFNSIGYLAFAANYMVIVTTVIYARPLITFATGLVLMVMSWINCYTESFLVGHPEIANESKVLSDRIARYSHVEFIDLLVFYLPMIIIISIFLSFSIKGMLSHIRDYANKQAALESSNKTAEMIQRQILESAGVDVLTKEHISIYPFLKTANHVAGDFYDFYNIDRYHVCFLIADVSGKGMAAGLFMVKTKDVLKMTAKDNHNTRLLIERANNELCKNNDECMFATVWLGILDIRTGIVNYINAGHTPPILISGENVKVIDEVSGPMLGLFPEKTYKSGEFKLKEGDRLLLYTDGVNEQPIDDKKRYEIEGITTYIKNNINKDDLCHGIYEDIRRYEHSQFDDITMLQLNMDKLFTYRGTIGKVIDRKCYLSAEPKSVRAVRKVIVEELTEAGVDKTIIDTFYVACEEMISNIIQYAYTDNDNNNAFVFYLHSEEDYISMMLKDEGVEFDPFIRDNSIAANTPGDITEGGRGIKIFTEIMDEYSYRRHSNTNIITGRKYI